ncbi:sporulation protein [Crateriforma spongiae]|uniref:sporulation protein n=1 Tax=Crateriforma spongiae TaxID=2724528 RepID=UPI001447FEE1|nr:sporulation protein [Crateriforma spongiae]
MAKCNLTVILNDPDRIYYAGDTVSGRVRVDVDAEVRCNALQIRSGWRTEGRGNVSRGETESIVAFSGTWEAGQTLEYPFELAVAAWPPTYHGHYLTVNHAVDAQAKISWAFDPKASCQYRVAASGAPESSELKPTAHQVGGWIAGLVAVVFFAFLAFVFVVLIANPVILAIVLVFAIVAGTYYFVRHVMPRMVLGEVDCVLDSPVATPGSPIAGNLHLSPKKAVLLDAVTAELTGQEVCVSGSGSNKKTHKHTLRTHTETLRQSIKVLPGVRTSIPFEFQLPSTDAYTLKLGDNQIRWTLSMRIAIPRWPDWRHSEAIQVVPPQRSDSADGAIDSEASMSMQRVAGDSPEDEITFDETASHFYAARRDRERLDLLLDAVSGMTFPMEVIVERRLLYSGDDGQLGYPDGHAVWARFVDPPLPMTLYVPGELADEFEQVGNRRWQGRATVVGWDFDHRRLAVRLERPS